MAVVDVALSPALADRQTALQAMLGTEYQVSEQRPGPKGIVVLDETSRLLVGDTRAQGPELGIIVLLGDQADITPRSVVAMIEEGADVCLVDPGTAGLAAHVRALAAHRPRAAALTA